MKKPLVTKSIGAVGLWTLLLLGPALVPVQGCTNLDESPLSSITPGNFYRNEAEVFGGLTGVYAQLRSTLDDYYNLSEISTDEMVVPTRGQDWYDNGIWLEIHGQTWTPTSPSGLGAINGAWVVAYTGIARANALLAAMEKLTFPSRDTLAAEARTLRAFYYYLLMDMFGGVPIVTATDIAARPRETRDSVFKFIAAELQAARTALPDRWVAKQAVAGLGRMTKGAADAILANMYLNAAVFTKDVGVSATAYNSCTTVQISPTQNACQAAVAAADRLLNSPVYQLADTFAKNFRADNSLSPENIFVIKFTDQSGLGLNFVMRALHYNQFNPSPWNGFATLAETYYKFDTLADARSKIFLVGPQFNVETGAPAFERGKNAPRLVFTPTIQDVKQATEGEGVRIYKWPYDPKHVAQDNGNDYAWFRLGEIYLIKAEALNELSAGDGTALTLLNQLRARDFNPPKPLAAVDRDVILQERLFELAGEAKRRQDLIRHGKYTQAWGFKLVGADSRILMPIPQTQLDANPLLKQNNGY